MTPKTYLRPIRDPEQQRSRRNAINVRLCLPDALGRMQIHTLTGHPIDVHVEMFRIGMSILNTCASSLWKAQ